MNSSDSNEVIAKKQLPPDEKFYTFVKNIEVAGTFKIENRYQVLKRLAVGERCKLVREPDNPHDGNAIEIYAGWEKLGYVPRVEAEKLAPVMDKEACLAGWITNVEPESGKIFVDIYRRNQIQIDSITSIHFEEGGYWAGCIENIDFSLRNRTMIYQIESWENSFQPQIIELKFFDEQWKSFVMPCLRKCNFIAWESEYVNPWICDGLQWSMIIRQSRKKQIRIYGSNDFPEEWDVFKQFIDDCLDLKHMRGTGRFYVDNGRALINTNR